MRSVFRSRCRAWWAEAEEVGCVNWDMTSLMVWMGVNRGRMLLLVNGSYRSVETGRE